jgi:hypothetical protein
LCVYEYEFCYQINYSPNNKPCVKEALKLSLDLKANMKENTENSLAVLSFPLLLSVCGLVTYFDEDEVLELFAFVAQHKIAVKLFGTLGFANSVPGTFLFMLWSVTDISPFLYSMTC